MKQFQQTLSHIAPNGITLKVGDKIRYTNDFGAVFTQDENGKPLRIIGFDESERSNPLARYGNTVFISKSSYWVACHPSSIQPQ